VSSAAHLIAAVSCLAPFDAAEWWTPPRRQFHFAQPAARSDAGRVFCAHQLHEIVGDPLGLPIDAHKLTRQAPQKPPPRVAFKCRHSAHHRAAEPTLPFGEFGSLRLSAEPMTANPLGVSQRAIFCVLNITALRSRDGLIFPDGGFQVGADLALAP